MAIEWVPESVSDSSASESLVAQFGGMLRDMESRLNGRLDELARQSAVQASYTTEDFARKVSRRPFTVREWCRLGRINATKRAGVGRGNTEEWDISHKELERYRNEGLLPLQRPAPAGRADVVTRAGR